MITRQTAAGRNPVSFPSRSEFELPLTTSVISLAGFGSVTYTRATVATVIDHEGKIVNVKSGEVRFTGARRVWNLFSYSQDLTNAAWTVAGITRSLHTETINGIPTYSLLDDATTVVHRTYQAQTFVSGNTYIASYYLKANTLAYAQIYLSGVSNNYANFDLSAGTVSGGTAGAGAISSLGNGWYRCSLKFTATSGGSNTVNLITITSGTSARAQSYLGTGVGYYASAAQLEDVTGQSIQTVGDYVSTNVLSSPFHGAMVDGVKYFDTDLLGNKLSPKGYYAEGASTNLLTQSNTFSSWSKVGGTMVVTANQGTGLDGANSLWKIATGTYTGTQALTLVATVTAAVHTYTVYAKAGENSILQLLTQGTLSNGYVNFDLSDGTIGSSSLWTGSITPVSGLPGVYKCVAKTDTLVAAAGNMYISQVPTKTTGRNGSMTGDGVSGIYVWGAQFELGSMSTSHIFTTGSTVTRNDDLLSYNVNNVNSISGGGYAEIFTDWQGSVSSNGMVAPRIFGGAGGIFLYIDSNTYIASNDQTTTAVGPLYTTSTSVQKVAITFGTNRNYFLNGVGDTGKAFDGNMGISSLFLGNLNTGTRALYGNMRNVKIWKTPPTDAEMVAITS